MQALLMIAVLAVAVPDRPDPTPKDNARPLPEQLIGEWRLVKQTNGGRDSTENTLTLLFTGKAMQHVHNRDGTRQTAGNFPYTLDTTKFPAVISFHPSNEAIFKIEGDILTICFSPVGVRQPPAQFESPLGTQVTIMQATRIRK